VELPSSNNVYGLLSCDGRLQELAQLLRALLAATESEISIKISQFDGAQTLRVRTERAEFDAYLSGADRTFLFNGAVAGTAEQVCLFVQRLHKALQVAGFHPRLEVYDDDEKCIAAFDA
jgi:alkanesulfonate monooxygenase SsuD/methylene tetrahydromethanopterin reductase-like flavin-dependent oxidoreductase (luciferase family)